ncbi:MAG: double-strand break repair protein AddB [Novosphingobium sp.]|nr:double-strand break repair protein AddB [Novosphingobium sp.]
MSEHKGPRVYAIAAHRGFADALVAGLIPRYRDPDVGLARLTLLLPSRRAQRTVTEAFVRLSGKGLLLPRMAMVGDLDLDETLGPLLDPLGGGADIPPAADPTQRWLRLAAILRQVKPGLPGAAVLRQAHEIGRTIDRLLVEGKTPDALLSEDVIGIVGDQAGHWEESTRTFLTVHAHWTAELAVRGEIDAPERRNRLFAHAAERWRASPPPYPVVAAGVTSASPALARLLRVVAELPDGAVILPDLDLALDAEVWDALGLAGMPEERGGPPVGPDDAVTHPQYHLKLLLNRMGVNRGEVQPWHRAGIAAAPPARSRAISNLFLPPAASARWVDLPEDQRRLAGVRLMESAHPEEQAQAVAVLIREALETPEKRVALVTPDRGLATRVVAHLRRWGIAADDTAGRPLPQTAAGRVLLLLGEVLAEETAPVPLLALLGHPLVDPSGDRAAWLERVRDLDLLLRGPRPAPGLAPIAALIRASGNTRLHGWWAGAEAILSPLFALGDEIPLAALLDALVAAGEALCGERLWSEADGRALAAWLEELRLAAAEAPTMIARGDVPAGLRDAMDRVAVRPPWGGHPRVAIYGLLEARMSRADLVICGSLHEGSWPAGAAAEPLLPPALLRHLGIPGGDFRIGLAAHDLAGALGAPEVVLSWARRDEAGPVIPSRFVLRVQAMLGKRLADAHRETSAVELARRLDHAPPAPAYQRPEPLPSAEQRKVAISATALDRLRGDPYQFYASSILGLRALDGLDAEPSPASKGTAAHAILDAWHKSGERPEDLLQIAEAELDKMSAHPLTRSLWRPRLIEALKWVAEEIAALHAAGRTVLDTEVKGAIELMGVRVHGRADRIDSVGESKLAIVDYKTGSPPSARQVEDGFALQLGVLGLIAREGGFEKISGEPERFEYWSLAKRRKGDGFGYCEEPIKEGAKKTGLPRNEFVEITEDFLRDAIGRWIVGSEPFTARLNPDLPGYADYDQLMRLDEWLPRLARKAMPA